MFNTSNLRMNYGANAWYGIFRLFTSFNNEAGTAWFRYCRFFEGTQFSSITSRRALFESHFKDISSGSDDGLLPMVHNFRIQFHASDRDNNILKQALLNDPRVFSHRLSKVRNTLYSNVNNY